MELGKAMGQFQRASRDFQRSINTEIAFEEEQEKKKANQKQAEETAEAGKTPEKEQTKA